MMPALCYVTDRRHHKRAGPLKGHKSQKCTHHISFVPNKKKVDSHKRKTISMGAVRVRNLRNVSVLLNRLSCLLLQINPKV